MDIGWYIRETRKLKKVTQQQLADAIGVSKFYISKIENGHEKPGAELVMVMAYHLNEPWEKMFRIAGYCTACKGTREDAQ